MLKLNQDNQACLYKYKLTIEYNGIPFCGWQRQESSISVQEVVEHALLKLCKEGDGFPRLHCSGRTDSSVHALAQVAHVSLSRNISGDKLKQALNYHINNKHIVIKNCVNLGENSDFEARFSCLERGYCYWIYQSDTSSAIFDEKCTHVSYNLDVNAMQEAANCLIGKHDFSSFRSSQCQANSPLRSIDEIIFNTEFDNHIFMWIRAKSFLHHQVRNIVGSLLLVGRGKIDVEKFKEILAAKDRNAAGPTAPAHGLYFAYARYEGEDVPAYFGKTIWHHEVN